MARYPQPLGGCPGKKTLARERHGGTGRRGLQRDGLGGGTLLIAGQLGNETAKGPLDSEGVRDGGGQGGHPRWCQGGRREDRVRGSSGHGLTEGRGGRRSVKKREKNSPGECRL